MCLCICLFVYCCFCVYVDSADLNRGGVTNVELELVASISRAVEFNPHVPQVGLTWQFSFKLYFEVQLIADIYWCVCAYARTFVFLPVCVCVCVCLHACLCTSLSVCVCLCLCMSLGLCVSVCVHIILSPIHTHVEHLCNAIESCGIL